MTIKFFCIFCLGCLYATISYGQMSSLLYKAIEFSHREQWDSAVACYNRLPVRNESFYFDRGMCFHLNSQFIESSNDFKKYTIEHPDVPDGWLMLAESSLYTLEFKTSQQSAKKFNRMEPRNSAAYFLLACAYLYANKKIKAHRNFIKATKYNEGFDWPKIYLMVIFKANKNNNVHLPACIDVNHKEYSMFPLMEPQNTFEKYVIQWHCSQLNNYGHKAVSLE